MLKKLLIGLVVLLALLTGVAFLLPREHTVVVTAPVPAPPEVVFPLLETPAEWPRWSPWNKRDPNMQITYAGPPRGQGATWSWTSASEGDGSMTITQAVPSVIVKFELTIAGMGPPSDGTFTIAAAPEGSLVEWRMRVDMGNNPIGRWIGLMMPTWLRQDFTDGLAALGAYAATLPPPEPIMGVEVPMVPDSTPH